MQTKEKNIGLRTLRFPFVIIQRSDVRRENLARRRLYETPKTETSFIEAICKTYEDFHKREVLITRRARNSSSPCFLRARGLEGEKGEGESHPILEGKYSLLGNVVLFFF